MPQHNLSDIADNQVLMATLWVWIIAQSMKVFIGVIYERRFNFKWLIGTGGMPSSHAAGAAALATSCGLHEGFGSVIFGVTSVFALVVMFDAQGVRRATGKQAAILNQVLEDIYWKGKIETEKLYELVGHTPLQVIIGAVLGITLASILYRMWI